MILKPGYKTTELFVTVLASIGSLVAALTSNLTPKWAAIASAISAGCYAISRGLAKNGATRGPVPTVPVSPPPPPAA